MTDENKRRFDAILSEIPPSATRILDLGCVRHSESKRQEGSLHDVLVTQTDAEVVGIDVEKEEIHKMQSAGYNVSVGDAHDLTESVDGEFDVIVAGEVIEHLHSPGQFLDGAADVLADDGKVIITTPNPDAFVFFRKALQNQTNNPTHTCWIDPVQLSHLCQVSGSELSLAEKAWLKPSGGVSTLLWSLGKRRAAAPTYIATLERG